MHFNTMSTYSACSIRLLSLAALSGSLLFAQAARAQTQGPATSFNVLSFGSAASAESPDNSPYSGGIPPIEYTLIGALNADSTQRLLTGGDLETNAGLRAPGGLSSGFGGGSMAFAVGGGMGAQRASLADLNAVSANGNKVRRAQTR